MAKRWGDLTYEERIKFFPCQLAFIEHSALVHDSFVAGKVVEHSAGDGQALKQCAILVLKSHVAALGEVHVEQ